MTRIAAEAVGVRRVSVWHWQADGRQLVCDDCYDRESGGHTRGIVLLREDVPQLFEALLKKDTLKAADAAHDQRTAELHRMYLYPLGCNGLLSTPIYDEDKNRGALWFEHESAGYQWRPEELSFVKAITGLLSLRLSAAQGRAVCAPEFETEKTVEKMPHNKRVETVSRHNKNVNIDGIKPAVHVAPGMRQTTIVDLRKQAFRETMAKHVSPSEAIGADVFEDVTVLVLQFTDAMALAEPLGDKTTTIAVDGLVHRLEELASASGVEYMKLMSEQLVCAAGFHNDGTIDHPRVIAELALGIQNACLNIFKNSRSRLDFRIGIDTGAVIGSMVGGEHKTYNLWGDAVRMAGRDG